MFPWEQPGGKRRQQHICCSRSWSPSQREGLDSTVFSHSPSVDERTSPVLHKLLWLLIAACPLQIYQRAIAALQHTFTGEHQKQTQWKNNTQPSCSQRRWRYGNLPKNPNSQKNREIWHMHKQCIPGPSFLVRLITTVGRAWGRGYMFSLFFSPSFKVQQVWEVQDLNIRMYGNNTYFLLYLTWESGTENASRNLLYIKVRHVWLSH